MNFRFCINRFFLSGFKFRVFFILFFCISRFKLNKSSWWSNVKWLLRRKFRVHLIGADSRRWFRFIIFIIIRLVLILISFFVFTYFMIWFIPRRDLEFFLVFCVFLFFLKMIFNLILIIFRWHFILEFRVILVIVMFMLDLNLEIVWKAFLIVLFIIIFVNFILWGTIDQHISN